MLRKKATTLFPSLYPNVEKFVVLNGFLRRLMQRNRLTEHAVTGVGQKIPADAPGLCDMILEDLASTFDKYEMVINMDETPMYFDMPANKTIEGKKRG